MIRLRIAEVDADGDGEIDYEFISLWRSDYAADRPQTIALGLARYHPRFCLLTRFPLLLIRVSVYLQSEGGKYTEEVSNTLHNQRTLGRRVIVGTRDTT
jgi:hypothetical protein